MQSATPSPERRCYCGKAYQVQTSLQRHARNCPASSEDCRLLLQLFACLEPRPIPGALFYRAFFPFRAWNENGNLSYERVFALPEIFESQERLERAIQSGINADAIQVTIGTVLPDEGIEAPWWAYRNFMLLEVSWKFIRSDLISKQATLDRELDIGRLLLHSFPIPDLDESFIENGEAFSPFLSLVYRIPVLRFRPEEIPRAIDVCLATSTFGEYQDKVTAISMAERLFSHSATPQPPDLLASIQLRQRRLSPSSSPLTVIPVPGRKGNAYLGEFHRLQAQQLAEKGQISDAWQLLQQWTPQNAAQPSNLEGVISSRIELMKGKLRRFHGDFESARLYLEPLASQCPAPRIQFSSLLQLAAVYGELGLWDKARAVLDVEATTDKRRRLLRLTTAELELAQGLAGSSHHLDSAQTIFTSLSQQYEDVPPANKGVRRNFFRICFGLAVISHLKRRNKSRFGSVMALHSWQLAYQACRECLVPTEGFPDLVCLLSIAETKLLLSDPSLDTDLHHAQGIWSEITRRNVEQRFFFANIGTRWLGMVCDWLEQAGKPPLGVGEMIRGVELPM